MCVAHTDTSSIPESQLVYARRDNFEPNFIGSDTFPVANIRIQRAMRATIEFLREADVSTHMLVRIVCMHTHMFVCNEWCAWWSILELAHKWSGAQSRVTLGAAIMTTWSWGHWSPLGRTQAFEQFLKHYACFIGMSQIPDDTELAFMQVYVHMCLHLRAHIYMHLYVCACVSVCICIGVCIT